MTEITTDFSTVDEIYEQNERVRMALLELVEGISDENASMRTEKGDWTVAGIVEHLAMAEEGMAKVARHLLKKAEEAGAEADGVGVSDSLTERLRAWRGSKGEAPDMVQPTNEKPVAESLAMMAENRRHLEALREKFASVNGRSQTFPHPIFGPLTAQDWLALIGAHESRHVEQIEKIVNRES